MATNFGVGINSNVILKDAVLDDKLWLKITFDQLQEVAYNPFEAILADEVVEKPKTSIDIMQFNLKVPKAEDNKGNKRTQAQLIEMVTRDINKIKAITLHIAKGYLVKDQIHFDPYRATGIASADDYNNRIITQGVLDQITKNYFTDFITMMKPFFGNEEYKFRLKLLRQSKDKHFPTLPTQYLEENPFWESMDIPESDSKVKFTKYEIDNGLNDPTPTAKAAADAPTEEAPMDAASVFGQ